MSTSNNGQTVVGQVPDQGSIVRLKVSRIRAWKDQPRKYFNEEALRTLGLSIKRRQRLPITVKKITDDPDHDYELIDGERRWRSAQLVGLEYLLGWVRTIESKDAQFVDSVVSNLCRADHTALEKAEALGRLHKMGMSRQDMADECGYSLGWIDQHLSLLRLEPEVQALMDPERPKEKQLTFSLALRLVALTPDLQRQVAEEIVDRKMPMNEARHTISKRAHEAGEGTSTNRSPNRDYRILTGFVARLQSESRSLLTMPNPTFVSMLGARSDQDVKVLTGQIETSITNLEKLVKKLKTAKDVVNRKFGSD